MTRLILATDIARHFSNLKTFSEKIKKKSFNFSLDEDRYVPFPIS